MKVGGVPIPDMIGQIVQTQKQFAEQAIKQQIQEAQNDPAKSVREIQQPSPLSQFLDIKV